MAVNVESLLKELDINVLIGVLSGRTTRAINRELQRSFRATGVKVTPDQWTILLSLTKNNNVTQQSIADITYRDKPNISRIAGILENKGLIKRSTDKSDKRNNIVTITAKGEEQVKAAHEAAIRTMQRALIGFTETDVLKLQKLLRTIFSNLA
jgi:DNA-binding MarR family transcriptional regulator